MQQDIQTGRASARSVCQIRAAYRRTQSQGKYPYSVQESDTSLFYGFRVHKRGTLVRGRIEGTISCLKRLSQTLPQPLDSQEIVPNDTPNDDPTALA